MIKQYMKRPVTIEAIKFEYTHKCIQELKDWLGDEFIAYGKDRRMDAKGWLQVGTLEDGHGKNKIAHVATEGDYIIKGIQGEFYACKPDIFYQTYQELNDSIVEFNNAYTGC
jgi:hypothetical protein